MGFDYDFGTSRSLSQAASATFADSSGEDVFQVRSRAANGAQRVAYECQCSEGMYLPSDGFLMSSQSNIELLYSVIYRVAACTEVSLLPRHKYVQLR